MTPGRIAPLLALALCFFTFAHTVRSIESLAISRSPTISAKYQKLTRHTLEEVGGRGADMSTPAALDLIYSIAEIAPARLRPERCIAFIAPIRSGPLHRRILPLGSEDAH
jgi:hypothetical protein